MPFNSFAEYAPEPNPETKKKDVVWFALNDGRPLYMAAKLSQVDAKNEHPAMSATPTRTYNPLPFTELEPKRFEDLVRQLVYDFRPWRRLEATGRSGSSTGGCS